MNIIPATRYHLGAVAELVHSTIRASYRDFYPSEMLAGTLIETMQ